MTRFTYDPNDLPGLVDHWFDQVGDLYVGKRYNGFVLLNDEAEVLDLFVVDVDGDLLGYPDDMNGWDVVIERAQACDEPVTNIICIHGHPKGEHGPCDGLAEFMTEGLMRFARDLSATFRFTVVLAGKAIDGVAQASLPNQVMQAMLDDDMDLAMSLINEMDDDTIPTAEALLASGEFEGLDAISAMLETLAEGGLNSPDELLAAIEELQTIAPPEIRLASEHLANQIREGMEPPNFMKLPPLNLPPTNYSN